MRKLNKKDLELMFEIGCLRFIPRAWNRFLNPEVANVSEHTLRVAWLALLLSEYENIKDKSKVLKLALIHDLAESRTNDVDYISRQYVTRHEENAIDDILQDTTFEKEFKLLWADYDKKSSIEAKIVKDADNLDVEFEVVEMEARGHCNGTIWTKQRRDHIHSKLNTESARKIWDKIHGEIVNDWHLKAESNRFKSGDWKK